MKFWFSKPPFGKLCSEAPPLLPPPPPTVGGLLLRNCLNHVKSKRKREKEMVVKTRVLTCRYTAN